MYLQPSCSLKTRPPVSESGQVNSTQPRYRNLRPRLRGFRPVPRPTSRRCCPSRLVRPRSPVQTPKMGAAAFFFLARLVVYEAAAMLPIDRWGSRWPKPDCNRGPSFFFGDCNANTIHPAIVRIPKQPHHTTVTAVKGSVTHTVSHPVK